jgi:hypothetical protein
MTRKTKTQLWKETQLQLRKGTQLNQDYKIEWWAIDKVIPYDKNPRGIPKSALHKVGLSLKENKWRQPIVVDKNGVIVVGHVRWMAARELGMDRVLVHVADDMTPARLTGRSATLGGDGRSFDAIKTERCPGGNSAVAGGDSDVDQPNFDEREAA